jgi:hypothetical protein
MVIPIAAPFARRRVGITPISFIDSRRRKFPSRLTPNLCIPAAVAIPSNSWHTIKRSARLSTTSGSLIISANRRASGVFAVEVAIEVAITVPSETVIK